METGKDRNSSEPSQDNTTNPSSFARNLVRLEGIGVQSLLLKMEAPFQICRSAIYKKLQQQ